MASLRALCINLHSDLRRLYSSYQGISRLTRPAAVCVHGKMHVQMKWPRSKRPPEGVLRPAADAAGWRAAHALTSAGRSSTGRTVVRTR